MGEKIPQQRGEKYIAFIENNNDLENYKIEKLEQIQQEGNAVKQEIQNEIDTLQRLIDGLRTTDENAYSLPLRDLDDLRLLIDRKMEKVKDAINKIISEIPKSQEGTTIETTQENTPLEQSKETKQEEIKFDIKREYNDFIKVDLTTNDENYLKNYLEKGKIILNFIDSLDEQEKEKYKSEYDTVSVIIEDIEKILSKRNEINQTEEDYKQEQIQEEETQENEKNIESKSINDKKMQIFEKLSEFGDFTDGQKHLIIENFLQLKFDIIKEDAQRDFRDDTQEQLSKVKDGKNWLGRQVSKAQKIWVGAKQSFKKEVVIAKTEKNYTKDFLNKELNEEDLKTLQMLAEGVLKSNVDAKVDEKGKLEILYAGNLDKYNLTEEQKKLADDFNHIATEFSQMPYEWSLDTARNNQRREFRKKECEFYDLFHKLNDVFAEFDFENYESNSANILSNVKLNQFLNQNQDIEKQIEKLKNQNVWLKAFKNEFVAKGGWMFAGALTRTLTMSGIGFIGGLIGAGAIGAMRSRDMGKKELTQVDKNARRGIDDSKKRNVVDLESTTNKIFYKRDENGNIEVDENNNPIIDKQIEITTGLVDKMQKLIDKINTEQDDNKKREYARMLQNRIDYTEDKLNAGLINFGDKENRLSNQYRFLEVLNLAKTTAYIAIDPEKTALVSEKLGKLLSITEKEIKQERNAFLLKKAEQGAIISATAFVAGYGARVLLENMGILAHNIDGLDDVSKLIKNGHLTDKDIDAIFSNPKLVKNEDVVNAIINSKKDLTGHIDKLLETYPAARQNTSFLENLRDNLTTSKSDKGYLNKLIENNLTQQNVVPSGKGVLENLDLSNMNANQIHELASQGTSVSHGGSVSETLDIGMTQGSKMTLITFDESGNPVVHENFDANVILEGAKIIKQGNKIFAIDEKNSYESFYKYYADHPEEIMKHIKLKGHTVEDVVKIPRVQEPDVVQNMPGVGATDNFDQLSQAHDQLDQSIISTQNNIATIEDKLNDPNVLDNPDIKSQFENELQLQKDLLLQQEQTAKDFDLQIENLENLSPKTSVPGTESIEFNSNGIPKINNYDDLPSVLKNVGDDVPTKVDMNGQEILITKEFVNGQPEFYADINNDGILEQINPQNFPENISSAVENAPTISTGSQELVENITNRPLTTSNIDYQDLLDGDKDTIKEFIKYDRPGGLWNTGGNKDFGYDIDTIYYNANLSPEEKIHILTNIKNGLEDTSLTSNIKNDSLRDSVERTHELLKTQIDHDVSLLQHKDGTPLSDISNLGTGKTTDRVADAFSNLDHAANIKETFYNPNISSHDKIGAIVSQMQDIPDGKSASFEDMVFTKTGGKVFYQVDSNHAIELTDRNLDRIMDWRHEAFSKIDLSKLNQTKIPDFNLIDDVDNAEKALNTFLSNETYSNKIDALKNVIDKGEQLTVGSATFARKGNDFYYVLSDNKGIKLIPENIDKINQMLSNARQEVLRDIAEGK